MDVAFESLAHFHNGPYENKTKSNQPHFPLIFQILVILILFALSKIEVKDKALLRAVCVLNAFTLSPIFGVMAYLYWKKWKKGESMRFIKPTDDWGPPDVTQRMHRNKYRPDKEIQSNKTDLNCTHHCLVDSKLYLIETVQKRMHFDSVEEIMRGNRKEYGV